jgi:hypothetical protein
VAPELAVEEAEEVEVEAEEGEFVVCRSEAVDLNLGAGSWAIFLEIEILNG